VAVNVGAPTIGTAQAIHAIAIGSAIVTLLVRVGYRVATGRQRAVASTGIRPKIAVLDAVVAHLTIVKSPVATT